MFRRRMQIGQRQLTQPTQKPVCQSTAVERSFHASCGTGCVYSLPHSGWYWMSGTDPCYSSSLFPLLRLLPSFSGEMFILVCLEPVMRVSSLAVVARMD